MIKGTLAFRLKDRDRAVGLCASTRHAGRHSWREGEPWAAGGCESDDYWTVHPEVIEPGFRSWMKERNNRTSVGVDSGKVWTLLKVATMTGKSEVGEVIGAVVLLRYDVFDVVRQSAMVFRELAVFAAVAGAMAYFASRLCRDHQGWIEVPKRCCALSVRIASMSAALMAAS